jgi:hypothetical protein
MPSWINQINDATILSDMRIASAMGVVSEQSMAKLFSDLAAKLSASNSTLSASQMADLKLIASDLSVDESVSSYVTYITGALVNGSLSNANWHGGSSFASYLGNLGVGSNGAQLYELIGKWFLGTDLPSVSNISGVNTGSVRYTSTSGTVFGVAGPQMSEINQGLIGDCYLCAALSELAAYNPGVLQSMIVSNGNDTYGVRFYVNGSAQYVTVNNQLPNGGTFFQTGPNLWGALVEKAYAQLQAGGDVTGGSTGFYGNSYATIGNGGYPWYTLEELTGATLITNIVSNYNHSSWNINYLSQSLSFVSGTVGNTTQDILSVLITALSNGNDVLLASYTTAHDSQGRITLEASHAFSIYGYDALTGLLELHNPWGTSTKQNWATTFEVSLSTLLAAGDVITIDNLSGNGNPTAPINSVAANASSLAGIAAAITVTDVASNVLANLDALQANTKLLAISLTDSRPVLSISSSSLQHDALALSKIMGTYSLSVTDSTHVNTAIYSDAYANYAIAVNTSTSEVQHLVSNSTPLMDATLTNVQRLQFTDTMVALDNSPTQTSGSAYMLYQAAFNRTPDSAGLGYWIAQLDKGANIITGVAQAFINSPEFVAKYGSNPSNASYVDNLYQNVLHRAGESGGVAYWNQQLNTGAATKAFVLEQFATLAEGTALVAPAIAHGIAYTQWVG